MANNQPKVKNQRRRGVLRPAGNQVDHARWMRRNRTEGIARTALSRCVRPLV